jgi:hypothetical protein
LVVGGTVASCPIVETVAGSFCITSGVSNADSAVTGIRAVTFFTDWIAFTCVDGAVGSAPVLVTDTFSVVFTMSVGGTKDTITDGISVT